MGKICYDNFKLILIDTNKMGKYILRININS